MPYLHLDLPATYSVQVKRELATRLCKVYAEVMETQLWRPTHTFCASSPKACFYPRRTPSIANTG